MPNKLIIKRLRRLLGSYGSYVEKALGVFSFCVEPGEQWAFSGLFYRLEVLEDGFSIMAEYPLTVPEERLGMAVEFLNAIGGQDKYGHFCLEMDTGKISYLLDCDCTACLPGEACLMDCIDQVADGLTRWDGPIRQLLDGARFLPEPLEEYTPGCVDASDYPGDGTFRDRFDQGRYRWVARLEAFYQAHPGWKKARTVFFLVGILLAALYCGAESVYRWLLLANSCWGNLYFAVNALEQVLPPHFMALGRDSGGLGHMGDPSRKRNSPAGIAPLRMPEHFCSPGLCCDLDISECEDPVSGVCPALFSWHFLLPAGNGGNSL